MGMLQFRCSRLYIHSVIMRCPSSEAWSIELKQANLNIGFAEKPLNLF